MSKELHNRACEIFLRVCESIPEERAELIHALCGDDAALEREVESLLRHDLEENQSTHAEHPRSTPFSQADSTPSTLPDQIGRYRILSVLGSGGMGVVYRAEQDQPRRIVALKVIRPGWVSPRALSRFRAEAETLGQLRHPGIAQVYDAGVAEAPHGGAKTPFIAMELVEGETLDEYIRRESPDLRRRVNILIKLCDAAHHAHEQSIVHRDLKPANILIEPDGQPRILDFGVARVTDLNRRSTVTQTLDGQVLGTLSYMSPEQASGDSALVDRRSDIYSIGAIAYEILGGRPPHSTGAPSTPEMLRRIQDDDPTPLSSMNRFCRGDLDTIVGKALEKDPDRRYATALELHNDLERHLEERPILARRPSAVYQLRKFARRNRLLVTATAIIFLTLVVAVILTSSQAIRATQARDLALSLEQTAQHERDRARLEAAKAQAASTFLSETIASANPWTEGGDARVTDILSRAERRAQRELRNEPDVESTVLVAVAESYRGLGEYANALRAYDAAHTAHERATQSDPEREYAILSGRGVAHRELGALDEADAWLTKALTFARSSDARPDELRANAQFSLALLRDAQGRPDESEALHRSALQIRERIFGATSPLVAESKGALGRLLRRSGDLEQAEPLIQSALAVRSAQFDRDDPNLLNPTVDLAELRQAQGRMQDSIDLYRRAVMIAESSLGPQHSQTAVLYNNLGRVLSAAGAYDQAIKQLEASIDVYRATLEPDHPKLAAAYSNLAVTLKDAGDLKRSAELHQQAVDIYRLSLGPDHPNVAVALNNQASVLRALDQFEAAEASYTEVLRILSARLGESHPFVSATLNNLGAVAGDQDQLRRSHDYFARALELRQDSLPHDHPSVAHSLIQLARAERRLGAYESAAERYGQALPIIESQRGELDALAIATLADLGSCHMRAGNIDQATPHLKRLGVLMQKADVGPLDAATNNLIYAEFLVVTNQASEAEPLIRDALEAFEHELGADARQIGVAESLLARVFMAQGELQHASEAIERALAVLVGDDIDTVRARIDALRVAINIESGATTPAVAAQRQQELDTLERTAHARIADGWD